jgi:methyl-accepting chemotaxis protein
MLVAGFSLQRLEDQAASAMRTTLVVAFVLMLLGTLVAYAVGRSIGDRVKLVVRLADRVTRGEIAREGITDTVQDEIGDIARSFSRMNANLTTLADCVLEVANGDLSKSASVEGELAAAFNRMVVNQRELVRQISSTATMLNAAAGEFFANAKQQARGATNQSSAVEQVRRTLETLLKSAREIGSTAEDVLESAERSQKNSQNVAEKIAALSHQTRSIAEILEVIKDIANKSDLLALNAGLEGTKAGEAGKGFSLVASQMQRLAENVMGAVRNIKELTTTITESTQATVLATEESTKLATDTTRSARQIGLTIQQQQSGTEQAVVAMVDVGEVASQTASGSKEIVSSATDLMKLSEQLQALVGRFRVGQASVPERHAAE